MNTLGMPAPAVLYKYLPPERTDIFENMRIRFSRPSEVNDPFDSHVLVPSGQGPRAKLARARLRHDFGIFCLAERADNPLMWVHYAKNHTGFVLGFDANAAFFHEDNRDLRKVSYRNRPKVTPTPNVDACFDKSKAWEYEEEWRCVRSFVQEESRDVEIKADLITQVIFGDKMEEWQRAKVVLYAEAQDMMAHTQFLVASPSLKSWTIETQRKTVSLCGECGSSGYLMKEFKITEQDGKD